MNYQGRLLTKEGTPVADGVYSISFRIYDAAEGGKMLWEEVHESVQVKGGFFYVLLGSINPLSSSLFNAPDRWLEVKVEGEQLQPRSRIATFPYAFNADTVDGKHAADLGDGHSLHASDGDPKNVVYVDTDGNVGIGTTSPNYKVSIQASGNDYYLSLSENEPGGADGFEFQIAPGGGTAKTRIGYLRGNFGSSSGFYIYNERNAPIRFGTNNIERMRITNTGNVGIGTTKPTEKLEVVGNVKATKFIGDGSGLTNLPTGAGDGHSLDAADGDPKDVVYVDNNGNVGIGTTSPNYKVSIQASGNDYYLSLSENEPGGADGFEFQIAPGGGTAKTRIGYLRGNFGSSSGFYIYNERNAPIRFGTNNIERMRITNTGNVGIGTTEPQYKLDVEGYVQAHGYYTGDIVFQKDGNKLWRMFEDEDGLYLENLSTGEIYRFVLEKVKK
jgi:hypothetical protein